MEQKENRIQAITDALSNFLDAQDLGLENISHIKFKNPVTGKGILWQGSDYTKQFVYQDDPERFFSSENIDISKGKSYQVDGVSVLNSEELGSQIVKSNLREVGRLKGLIVDGGFKVNNYLVYDAGSDRLGIGTDEPNATLSVVDGAVEIVIGSHDYSKGAIGTFNSADLEIVTDNTPRITVSNNGNISLGNFENGEIKVNVNGSLGINVSSIDSRAKLHVNGAIKFNDNIHLKGTEAPAGGTYTLGDIVWNSEPRPGSYVGWVCTKAGNPGIWSSFGEIR